MPEEISHFVGDNYLRRQDGGPVHDAQGKPVTDNARQLNQVGAIPIPFLGGVPRDEVERQVRQMGGEYYYVKHGEIRVYSRD